MKDLYKIICLSVICCGNALGWSPLGFDFFGRSTSDNNQGNNEESYNEFGKGNNEDEQSYSYSSSSSTSMINDGNHMQVKTFKETDDNGVKETTQDEKEYLLNNGKWIETSKNLPRYRANDGDAKFNKPETKTIAPNDMRILIFDENGKLIEDNFRENMRPSGRFFGRHREGGVGQNNMPSAGHFFGRHRKGGEAREARDGVENNMPQAGRFFGRHKNGDKKKRMHHWKKHPAMFVNAQPDVIQVQNMQQQQNMERDAYVDFLNRILRLIKNTNERSDFNKIDQNDMMSFWSRTDMKSSNYKQLCQKFFVLVWSLAESLKVQSDLFAGGVSKENIAAQNIKIFFKEVSNLAYKMIVGFKGYNATISNGLNFDNGINPKYLTQQFQETVELFLNDLHLSAYLIAKEYGLDSRTFSDD